LILPPTPEHLNQETDQMSTPKGADQPTSADGYSYSRGLRQFSRMVLHPGLRLLIKLRWQGKENIPRTGGIILAPNHLSYADWATIAIFSDGYAHRYPVFMIKSGIFGVKVIGPLMYKFGQLPVYRDRGDAGLVLKQAEQALRAGAAVIVYPEGTASRDPDLWPMVGKTGAARLARTPRAWGRRRAQSPPPPSPATPPGRMSSLPAERTRVPPPRPPRRPPRRPPG